MWAASRILDKLLDFELSTRFILLVAFLCVTLLWLPDDWASVLKLADFRGSFGQYFGIAFMGSVGILGINTLAWMIKGMHKKRRRNAALKVVKNSVACLDEHEKAVLREFYIQGKSTIELPIDNHVVTGLLEKGILSQQGQYGRMWQTGLLWPVCMSDLASQFINWAVVGMPLPPITEDKRERIREARPECVVRRSLADW